jgi:hypothetical protein
MFFRSVRQQRAVDDDPALLVLLQRVDAADQRRLARPRGAADHDPLALDRQVDVAQHVERAEPLVHAPDLDGDLVRDLHLRTVDLAILQGHLRVTHGRVSLAVIGRELALEIHGIAGHEEAEVKNRSATKI